MVSLIIFLIVISNVGINNLLEYPLYTKPRIWKNRKVPEVLLSGNHSEINKWKIEKAKEITLIRRKDLLNNKI